MLFAFKSADLQEYKPVIALVKSAITKYSATIF